MLYVVGIPSVFLENVAILSGAQFFGNFGKVVSINVTSHSQGKEKAGKKAICSAFVTYEDHYSAALAILSMDKLKLDDKKI